MRVVFLNFRNNGSSALLRTSRALSEVGVSVHSFTFRSFVKEDLSLRISLFNWLLFYFNFLIDLFITRFVYRKSDMFFSRNLNLWSRYLASQYIRIMNSFDLVNIHWVGHGFISTDFLLRLKLNKLVITFHDYYFLTGGCHVPIDCEKYIAECRNCPAAGFLSDFQLNNFKEKKKLFKEVKVFAIAPSEIMALKIRKSELGKLINQVFVVPNPIDTIIYKPLDLKVIRSRFNNILPKNKKVILFVASDLSDKNKGLDLLLMSLSSINKDSNFCLVTVGAKMPVDLISIGFEIINLGPLNDTAEIVDVYNRAYLTVVPSRFETFSQVTLESLSCGTPVVAFDSSGPSEIITDGINGFLVESFSCSAFGNRIEMLLLDYDLRNLFGENGRKMVEEKYCLKAVGELLQSSYSYMVSS
jgi:glycosyltransferase involved in cell wall biosynthesis